MQNIDELANALDLFQRRKQDAVLQDFLATVSLDPRSEDDDKKSDEHVTLMTFHGSKGLNLSTSIWSDARKVSLPHQRQPSKGAKVTVISPAELMRNVGSPMLALLVPNDI